MTEQTLPDRASTTGKTTPRLDSLTSLRFVFAVLVFWYHATNHAPFHLTIFNGAYGGVSFFFLLSGFVMSWSTKPHEATGRFYLRRFARIYPLYLSAWVCAIVIQFATNPHPAADLIAVTLLQSWFPQQDIFLGGSAPFWSLSVEAFLYAMFPLIHLVLVRVSMRGLGIAAIIGFVMSMTVPVILFITDFHNHLWLGYTFPPTRLGEFILGAAAGAAYIRGFRLRLPLSVVAVVAIAAFVISPYLPRVFSYYAFTVIPYGILILAFATADLEGRKTWLNHQLSVRFGDWSYAFYLFHAIVLTVCFQIAVRAGFAATKSVPAFWVTSVVAFVVAGTVAGIGHHYIERPMVKRIGKWSAHKQV